MKHYKIVNEFDYVTNSSWLRRLGAAGFTFFLVKGLVWVIAAVWIVY